ncbi:MAG: response regulator [Burkholderiales bacterium]|nr:response regulator [Burkholderiales bacterium]
MNRTRQLLQQLQLAATANAVRNVGPIPRPRPALPQRVLIVEDGRVLAKNMKTYLARSASDVRTAADATQAFAMLDEFVPDALVLDYGLPGADGLQIYAEIVRRKGRRIVCVMVTGDSSIQLADDARELGIQHVICKPFQFSELQRILEIAAETEAGSDLERPAVDSIS